jgi:hypothetical protein
MDRLQEARPKRTARNTEAATRCFNMKRISRGAGFRVNYTTTALPEPDCRVAVERPFSKAAAAAFVPGELFSVAWQATRARPTG